MKYFNLVINNIPCSKSDEETRQYFERIAEIIDFAVKENDEKQRYYFLELKTAEEFEKVLSQDGISWEGNFLSIRKPGYKPPASRVINVAGIPATTTKNELEIFFEQFGEIENIDLKSKQGTCFAFITFVEEAAKNEALDRKNIQFKDKNIQIREYTPNQKQEEWSLEKVNTSTTSLEQAVDSDINYKGLEVQIRQAHHARIFLLGDGQISLAQSLALEERIKACWEIKQKRLERAIQEFESDLASIEENLDEFVEDYATWESYFEMDRSLKAVNDYLSALDLPIDYTKLFEKRIRFVRKQLVKLWLDKFQTIYDSLFVKFNKLQQETITDEKSRAILTRYQSLKGVKEELLEFFNILNEPILTLRKNNLFIKLKNEQQQLWLSVKNETGNALSNLKSAREMVLSAVQSCFEISQDEQANLRDKYEHLEDVKELIKETGVIIPREQSEQLSLIKNSLDRQIKIEVENLIELVNDVKNEASDTREPEKILDKIKQLHQVKKTLPYSSKEIINGLKEISNELSTVWDDLSNRVVERNRRVSEELSKQIDEIQEFINTENIIKLYKILRNLSDRIKRSPLSRQWKSVEENRISKLFGKLRTRENEDREEASKLVQQVESALQSDAEIRQVRDLVQQVQNRLKEIELRREARQEFTERLEQVWQACNAFGNAAVQEIEPLVNECELLLEQERFDLVFIKIHQVQQLVSEKINTQGLARSLYPLRQRLNKIWQMAQEKHSQSAFLLESLLEERISACERMAQDNDEQDFIEIFNAIDAAQKDLKTKLNIINERGLRLSKSPEKYRNRLQKTWEYTDFRARRCGEETSYLVRNRATEISKMLETNAHIGQIFSQLHELNNLQRTKWKNKQDIENLYQLVSSIWKLANEKAQKQSAEANETALQAVERSMILADRWFDWKFINEQLRETEKMLKNLPLSPYQKRLYQEQISLQFDLLRERQQKEQDEVFDHEWLLKRRWYCIERGMVDIKNQRWPKNEIQDELSEHDLFVLTHIYDIVLRYCTDSEGNPFSGIEYDETTLDYVIIRKFRLPSIWHQPFTKIRIDFPPSYPHTPSIGWYMENNLTIKGWENAHHYFPNMAFHGAKTHQGWAWYCCNVKSINEAGGWRPSALNNPRRKDNLWSYLNVIQSALSSEV
jgi:RNA recognition motif. (a.k.a. RRM, RBD, or RNP domain)